MCVPSKDNGCLLVVGRSRSPASGLVQSVDTRVGPVLARFVRRFTHAKRLWLGYRVELLGASIPGSMQALFLAL